MIRIVLFQPDIPQNAGACMRLAACLGAGLDIVEPSGFVFDDRRLRRAGLDYRDLDCRRWPDWDSYRKADHAGRLILLTTKASTRYTDCAFGPDDRLLLGRESSGVPDFVHDQADMRLTIPLAPGRRSLNLATAAAMALGEALRPDWVVPADADWKQHRHRRRPG